MHKEHKEGIPFGEFLSQKNNLLPYSINIESVEEDFVISEDFEDSMSGVDEISFLVSDFRRDIKDYTGFLAFMNVVKAKNIIKHSNVYLELEYSGEGDDADLILFYEKLNLWNVRLLIKPSKDVNVEGYANYLGSFIPKVINKETFVSMEPVEGFIREKTAEIYGRLQDRDVHFEHVPIVQALVVPRLDFDFLRSHLLASFRGSQVEDIELMVNSIGKSVFDIASMDSAIVKK